MLPPYIFREYDIRGIADVELPDDDVEQLGLALGTYLIRHSGRNVVLARDCRLSSDRLHDALLRGVIATGCQVIDIGITPTPVLYYAVIQRKADGGIMITGSHNPSEYNGFKTVSGASTIHGTAIQHVYKLVKEKDYEQGHGSVVAADLITPYVDELAGQFSWPRNLRVVFDAGNGTAGPVMKRLLQRLNVEATELYFDMDGRFPHHHPDPTMPDNLTDLQRAVQERGAELGIAFDGDADRIGAIDEEGRTIYGDMLMLIYGRDILKRKPGATFIGEVKCSQVMYDQLQALGGHPIMYKTGHSLIKAKMKEEHAQLAGEMSGHMFFADRYYGFDDAMYAACRLLEIVSCSGHPLSYQMRGIPPLVSTPELRIDCPDEFKFRVVTRVAQEFRQHHQVIDIDGVRVPFANGWGLVRASNTQPVLVMRFEATNRQELAAYQKEMERAVESARQELNVPSS